LTEDDIKGGDVIIAKGIRWDTDGDRDTAASLPNEARVEIPEDWDAGSDSVADLLSDEHGFCIEGIDELIAA
jgi:hypothetical protein